MLNALRLLETLAITPSRGADRARLLHEAAVPEGVRNAIRTGDIDALRRSLGCAQMVYCSVCAPENDDPVDEPQREDTPAEQDEPKAD